MVEVSFSNFGFAALGDGPKGLPPMRCPFDGGVDGADDRGDQDDRGGRIQDRRRSSAYG